MMFVAGVVVGWVLAGFALAAGILIAFRPIPKRNYGLSNQDEVAREHAKWAENIGRNVDNPGLEPGWVVDRIDRGRRGQK